MMAPAAPAPETAPVPPVPEAPSPALAVNVVIGSLVLFALIAGLMYRGGLFDKPENAVQSDVLAAVLVLVGTLLTELLVAAGLIVKHSLDVRTFQLASFEQQRLQAESQRDHNLKVLEQERLRKDTVLHAVELLSTDDGGDAGVARQVGALQALATLGEHPLAVSLLDQRWSDPSSPVLPVAGALAVLDCVFDTYADPTLEGVRAEAASVLNFNARKLITEDDVMLPRVILHGTWLKVSRRVALTLVLASVKASASVFPKQPAVPSELVRHVASYLYVYARDATDERSCLIAAYATRELARALRPGDLTVVNAEELSPEVIEQRMTEIIGGRPVPLAGEHWTDQLRDWADRVRRGGPVAAPSRAAPSRAAPPRPQLASALRKWRRAP